MIPALIISIICVLGWVALNITRYNKFIKNVKPDDPVRFFIGEKKHTGILIEKYKHGAKVQNQDGVYLLVKLEDIYPVQGYGY